MSLVNFPIMYINNPTKNKPNYFGKIYIGEAGLDPITNPKQLRVKQNDGTLVDVDQPFELSAGGNPEYNGEYVELDVDGNYSMSILDKNNDPLFYVHDTYDGNPVTEESQINDLSQTYEFKTWELMKDSAITFPDGKTLETIEHTAGTGYGGAKYVKTTGSSPEPIGSPDLAGGGYALFNDSKTAQKYGAISDGVTDSSDQLIALKTGGGNILIEPGDYVIHKNWVLEDNTYVEAAGASFLARDTWIDQTSNNPVNRRSVVLIGFVDNVQIKGLVVDTDVTIASEATTPFMVRGSNNVTLDGVSGTHPDARTLTINPFDVEGTNTNITIRDSYFKNTTGSATGLCNIRNVASGTLTKNIKVLNCVFDKDSGDEVLAVYGVLGKTTDVIIDGNTFNSSNVKNTHGAFISIFPLVSDPSAEVNNVRFTNNTVIATGFIDSVLRVGSTPDVAQKCDNVFIENNNFVVANALTTALIIRFIKNIGDNVTCNNNTFSQVGTDICQSLIAGPWRTAHNNTGTVYAKQIFEGCAFVSSNEIVNPSTNGIGFYNCNRVSNNIMESERGARIEAAEMTSEIINNKFVITGSGSDYVLNSNDLGTLRVPTFIFSNNDVETTNVTPLNIALSFDASVTGVHICRGNTFRGVSPTDVFAGVKQSFSVVEGNEWWDYTDMTSTISPYRSAGYNNMVPIGNLVTSSAIGASAGALTIGWIKAEGNSLGVDWKAVEATIL